MKIKNAPLDVLVDDMQLTITERMYNGLRRYNLEPVGVLFYDRQTKIVASVFFQDADGDEVMTSLARQLNQCGEGGE